MIYPHLEVRQRITCYQWNDSWIRPLARHFRTGDRIYAGYIYEVLGHERYTALMGSGALVESWPG